MHVAVHFHSVEHSGGRHSPRSQCQCGQVECQGRVHTVTEGKEKMSELIVKYGEKIVVTIALNGGNLEKRMHNLFSLFPGPIFFTVAMFTTIHENGSNMATTSH